MISVALAVKILGGVAYAALEYWLGKTDKVKAGSLLEVGVNLVKGGLERVKRTKAS